ncbi:nitrate regulatory gene2 protein-like [Actinidia eriantha]|uniref:nitrate regulatory gene2 protein-like n=1 Tax=Actinidia eriantha TaxID=165200 RepID=UPI0025826FE3|nr:nitrate regulatory gene2 protein-like [Actinidia eriantha]XP_057490553.1 nitrate regulatory gene2 protein-like [Actinidia eriantha]
MGCGGSKLDDLPLVIRCRERKGSIKAAADHRYALAAAHVAYFHSLKEVGDALRQFVDEELVMASPSSSPVLTLPSDEGKTKKNKNIHNNSSSSTSLSHSGSGSHIHLSEDEHEHDGDGSHLRLSSGSDSEPGSSSQVHIHTHRSPEIEVEEPPLYSSPPGWGSYGFNPNPQTGWGPYGVYPPAQTAWGSYGVMNSPPHTDWGQFGVNSRAQTYYMKRSSPQTQSVIYDPRSPESSYAYMNSYSSKPYENSGFFGYPMPSPSPREPQNQQRSPPLAGPPPPPSPKVSAWDFFNPFDMYDSGYNGYYSHGKSRYGSVGSSPDSSEVREREGIPDLEDETEPEGYKEAHKEKKKLNQDVKKDSGEGSSRALPSQKESSESSSRAVSSQKKSSEGSSGTVPLHGSSESTRGVPSQSSEGTSRKVPSQYDEAPHSVNEKVEKSSPDTIVLKNMEDGSVRKKGVTFEVDVASTHNTESSKLSSLTALSAHGTRDLQEVVAEIRDDFATASSYGKEVAMLLEVGKLPYQPRFTLLKVILSRLCMKAPSVSSSSPPPGQSVRVAASTIKLAKSYYGDSWNNTNVKPGNLSSTLEKLYTWEKKLYKEVKDEERLRVIYEKQCKRLKTLDDRGAESSKIDATQASVRKLLTKLNVCIKAVDVISRRIHKLRDEELQPLLTELIYGLIRMWKAMLKCHQKQFQAIGESKTRSLRANTGSRGDSRSRATMELEMVLRTWCDRFGDWISSQKSFIESLNEWLLRCLFHEPEETPDGIVPFSPGRIGAPPIFVISNDWFQAMETISETGVANAMRNFASNLRELWDKQDEEQRQRLKAEYLSKDFERRLRSLHMDRGKLEREQDVTSDKTSGSIIPSESGVSPLDDLKVDLDSMKHKLKEERARHKEAVKLVHNAASNSLQSGLIPIFEALGNFTSEALKAYEHVRI